MKFTSKHNAPLSDMRILDLADEKACFCTKLLADMGAYVIKVEKPGGDAARNLGPFFKGTSSSRTSLSFFFNNTNKLSITLNLKNKEGREIFLKLVKETDVIVETFPPDFLKKCGLDFETLSGVNSRLILASVTGFGRQGPRRDYKACDLVLSAFGGQMYVCGSPSAAPLKAFGGQSHHSASLFAAFAIMLALRQRAETGEGQHIDISLQASVTATLEHVMHRYFAEGVIHRRRGSRHWNDDFCVLPCKDGFIQATLFQHWETMIEWLDGEGMAEDLKDEKWLDEDYRREHLAHVVEVLEKWTATHTRDEIFELAQLMRFPWAPVQTPDEILHCPQLNARNFFVEQDFPQIGATLKYPGMPFRYAGRLHLSNAPAPQPGEHNEKIYRQQFCDVLGNPAWTQSAKFSSLLSRKKYSRELNQHIGRWTAGQKAEHAVKLLQQVGVPAGVVQNAADLAKDRQLLSNDFFAALDHPVLGELITETYPFMLKGEQRASWKSSPLLGEDNQYVYGKLLGLSETQVRSYADREIIA